jgi:DNA-binding response OmpR family regulator
MGYDLPHHLFSDELHLDLQAQRCTRAGQPILLGPLEFALLFYLAQHIGAPVPYVTLLHEVWQCEQGGTLNQLKSCVKRLRHAIEPDPHRPRYVLNVRGYGYVLVLKGNDDK